MHPHSAAFISGRRLLVTIALAAVVALIASVTAAPAEARRKERYFERIATYDVAANGNETAEISAVSKNGRTVVFTDAATESVGFVDITDPSSPTGLGRLELRTAAGSPCEELPDPQDADGTETACEPTSVAVGRSGHALVAVNTSLLLVDDDEYVTDYENPDGFLAVVDIPSRSIIETIPLGGQPDAVAVNWLGTRAAIAIENERNEDLDFSTGGQLPAGYVVIVDMFGSPSNWNATAVDLTGLPIYVPADPEPEYIDVWANTAAVTLQENNAVVLINMITKKVIEVWDAGTVSLGGIDTVEDGLIDPTGAFVDRPREPDAIAWISGSRLVTANEGDLDPENGRNAGGTRGFTVFDRKGSVKWDVGTGLEYAALSAGHYPEDRSENKGNEPEGVAYDRYGWDEFLFVGSERANFVAVYDVKGNKIDGLRQILPTTIGPEGLLPVPERNLLVVSSEVREGDWASTLTIFRLVESDAPEYPEIVSQPNSAPIGWVALSGLATNGSDVFTVHDSYLGESSIYRVDATQTPAVITEDIVLDDGSGGTFDFDLEGIEVASAGGFWLASEGGVTGSLGRTENLLIRADDDGLVTSEILLPDGVVACRNETIDGAIGGTPAEIAFARELRFGFEGVAEDEIGRVYVAQQREWNFEPGLMAGGGAYDCDALSAPAGLTRIWRYDPSATAWDYVDYELQGPGAGSWVGLSEITYVGGGDFVLIERDNKVGNDDFGATIKTLVLIEDLASYFASAGGSGEIANVDKSIYTDLKWDLANTNGWITDKPEGFTVVGGDAWVVSDNDGVEDASGETRFINLGPLGSLFD